MKAIQEFCEKNKISRRIESAFTSYCRTTYALRFELREGDTVARVIATMNEEQVKQAWNSFVTELKDVLTSRPEKEIPVIQKPPE